MTDQLKKHLEVLEIHDEIAKVTLSVVNASFRRLAKLVHPDKATEASTTAFQELLNSCQILRKYLKDNPVREEGVHEPDDDCKFFDDNFEKFNFSLKKKEVLLSF